MDEAVDRLLELFASKVAGHHPVLEADPRRGRVVLQDGARVHRLEFDRQVLAEELAGHDDDAAQEFWGRGVDQVESLARFLTIHLDESLATREPHPSGRWMHRSGGFDPVPP